MGIVQTCRQLLELASGMFALLNFNRQLCLYLFLSLGSKEHRCMWFFGGHFPQIKKYVVLFQTVNLNWKGNVTFRSLGQVLVLGFILIVLWKKTWRLVPSAKLTIPGNVQVVFTLGTWQRGWQHCCPQWLAGWRNKKTQFPSTLTQWLVQLSEWCCCCRGHKQWALNSTPFWQCPPGGNVGSHGWQLRQGRIRLPTSNVSYKFRPLALSWGSHDPSLCSANLLEQSRKSGKHIYQGIIKDIRKEADKEISAGEGAWGFPSSLSMGAVTWQFFKPCPLGLLWRPHCIGMVWDLTFSPQPLFPP
jgi:hypothetical protein